MPQGHRRHKKENANFKVWQRFFAPPDPKPERDTLADEISAFNEWLASQGVRRPARQRQILERVATQILKKPGRSLRGVNLTGRIRRDKRHAYELQPNMDGEGALLSTEEKIEKARGGVSAPERFALAGVAFHEWQHPSDDEPEDEFCSRCVGKLFFETTVTGALIARCSKCGHYESSRPPELLRAYRSENRFIFARRCFGPSTVPVKVRPRFEIALPEEVIPFINLRPEPRGNYAKRGTGKWAPVIERACGGEAFEIMTPSDVEPKTYAANLRSMLMHDRKTMLLRWSVRTQGRLVKVAPIGSFEWAQAAASSLPDTSRDQ